MRALVCIALAALAACGGGKSEDSTTERSPIDAGPPARYAHKVPIAPPAAPAPSGTIGSGPDVEYLERVRLVLGKGVERPKSPMKVSKVWPISDRPLAVAYGTTAAGAMLQMIDLDSATIRWVDTEACVHPVVHTTTDRIICAGWKGIHGLNVDSPKRLWEQPLMFRAAGAGRIFARDATDPTRGSVIDVSTGKIVTNLLSPEKDTFDEVEAICYDDDGFDLYAWNDEGVVRKFRGGHHKMATEVDVVWRRKLSHAPSKLVCGDALLIEVPIPGSEVRTLTAHNRRTGKPLSRGLDVYGWWPAREGDGIETATAEGIQVRNRKLGKPKVIAEARVGGRLVASWADMRLVRSVSGTLMLLDGRGFQSWLGTPGSVDRAVMSSSHLLAGSWLMPSQSNAERLALYRLPPRDGDGAFDVVPGTTPRSEVIGNGVLMKVPATVEVSPGARVDYPKVGSHGVGEVIVDGERLYAVALESRPSPNGGAGLAAFDFRANKWLWNRDDVCAPNAAVVGLAAADGLLVCGAAELHPGGGAVTAVDSDTGDDRWEIELPTVDRVLAVGDAIVAVYGARSAVLSPADGSVVYEIESDRRNAPQVVVVPHGDGGVVVAVEPSGDLVGRKPDGTPLWSVAINGYVRKMFVAGDRAAVHLATGELFLVAAGDGAATQLGKPGPTWHAPGGGDLVFDGPIGASGEVLVRAFELDGRQRLFAAYAVAGHTGLSKLRTRDPKAPLALMSRHGATRVRLIEPERGTALSSHMLPPRSVFHAVFTAAVDGRPIGGVVLQKPLGIQLF